MPKRPIEEMRFVGAQRVSLLAVTVVVEFVVPEQMLSLIVAILVVVFADCDVEVAMLTRVEAVVLALSMLLAANAGEAS
jgi:hypothetical protein